MNCTIFSYEKTMGIRKLGGDNTEKKNDYKRMSRSWELRKWSNEGHPYNNIKNKNKGPHSIFKDHLPGM